jgi:hypothetical protein
VSENVKPNESTQETDLSCREFDAVSYAAGLAAAVAGPRCAGSRDGLLPTGTRCWSQIRSIAPGRRPSSTTRPAATSAILLITKLPALTGPPNVSGAMEKVAYVAFLDAQKEVDRTKKIGTQGTACAVRVKTAAAVPDRIAAGASAQWRDRSARWNRERETGKGRSA